MVVMILLLSCLTHAESIRDVWLKANASGPLGDRISYFESVYHRDWTSICMKPESGCRNPLVGRLNGLRLATTSEGLTCVPLQSYSLVRGSGAPDAQVQVVQCLL